MLRLKSKTKAKIIFDQCYQFLLSLAYLDTKREEIKELIINKLVKRAILYEYKVVVFYPCDTLSVKINNNDDFGGNESNDDDQNSGNSSSFGGSNPVTFGPP